jgi:hypothetical protein
MELSPEDRQRIYAEEKARLEAQQPKLDPTDAKKAGMGCGAIILITIGAPAIMAIVGSIADRQPKAPGTNMTSAQIMAEDFVRNQLKAPSTAKFGGQTVMHIGGESYRVTGYVDAENAFGARLRKVFVCTVRDLGADKWQRVEPCGLLE